MIKHIMLLKVHENDDADDNIDQLREELLAAADETGGLVSAEVGYNVSSSNFDVAFIVSFKNPTALKHFYSSDKYKHVRKFIDTVSTNVSTVDFMTDPDNTIKRDETEEKKMTTPKKTSSKSGKSSSKSGQKSTSRSRVAASASEDFSAENNETPSSQIPVRETPLSQAIASQASISSVPVRETPLSQAIANQAKAASVPVRETPVAPVQSAHDDTPSVSQTHAQVRTTPVAQTPVQHVNNVEDNNQNAGHFSQNSMSYSNVTAFPNSPNVTRPVDDMVTPVARPSRPVDDMVTPPVRPSRPVDDMVTPPVRPSKPVQVVTEIQDEEPAAEVSARTNMAAQASNHITYAPIDADDSMTNNDGYAPVADVTPANRKKVIIDDDVVVKRIEPKGKQIKEGEYAMEDAWKCPVCGKINGVFVGICGCGAHIPEIYTPLSNMEVAAARLSETPEAETDDLTFYGHNMVAPSMDDLVNTIKPVVTKTVNAIKRSVSDDYEDPAESKDDDHVTAAQRAAANLSPEDMVDTVRIEPKGKQIKDGESAMEAAWKCPLCGKINGGFVGICGCGAHIPDNYIPVPPEEIESQSAAKKDAAAKKTAAKKTATKKTTSTKKNTKAAANNDSSIKNITDSITKTITDAMNTSLDEDLPAKTTTTSKGKKASYNEKLLNPSVEENKTKRIEPKGSAPSNGESAMANSWTCPTCGKVNAKYIGKCGCGTYKDGDEQEFA